MSASRIELSDNCYLIRHGADWLLWDTGYPDAIAEKPVTGPVGTATRAKTLAAQLAEVGVKPADIRYVAVSHITAITSATSTCSRTRRC